MFWENFRIAGSAITQIFLLAAVGFVATRKKFLAAEGVDAISRLTMDITLPALIFCQLLKDFSFSIFPNWWVFPLISVCVTLLGFLVGWPFSLFLRGIEHKMQFLSLVTFQNSGYLPLALVAALLSGGAQSVMFIYIFLFLIGFNLVMFSVGVHMLVFHKNKKFELGNLFSAPVVATLLSLILIAAGANKFVPQFIFKPLQMIGDCTLPLAMIVVGGNLAEIKNPGRVDTSGLLVLLAKMVVLPFIGLFAVILLNLPYLVGLLILIQFSMPSAVTLSAIVRYYKKEDLLISQGIFLSHIFSIISIPVFLILYFSLSVIK